MYFIPPFRLDISVVLFVSLVPKGRHISSKFCQMSCVHRMNYKLTAAGVWPACQLETNLFCWARQSAVVGGQHASRVGFIVATTASNKVVDMYFLVWSLSRLLCWFCRQFSHSLRPHGHQDWLIDYDLSSGMSVA